MRMDKPKKNVAKRFCFLFLLLSIASALGFFALIAFGRTNAERISPEFFTRVGQVFGGLMGLFLALSGIAGIAWRSEKKASN
jgi:hypothetical protein